MKALFTLFLLVSPAIAQTLSLQELEAAYLRCPPRSNQVFPKGWESCEAIHTEWLKRRPTTVPTTSKADQDSINATAKKINRR